MRGKMEKNIFFEYFNFNEFKDEVIKSICKDVINDFKSVDALCEDASFWYNQRFNRHPRISFKECFKSKEHMIVFFFLFAPQFSSSTHGCGDFEKNILDINEETEDITELAVEWKRKMFSIIDSLDDVDEQQKVFAKTSVIEYWSKMNISDAPEEDLEDLAYVD